MKILVGGDFAPKNIITSLIKKNDFSFFNELKKLTDKADLSIINMESPFITKNDCPILKWGPNLGCTSKTVDALTYVGINVVTLANNHIKDYGETAMFRTEEICNANNIKTVGIGKNISDAQKTLQCKIKDKVIGIINCCEHEFSIADTLTPGANPLNPISQYYSIRELKPNVDIIIVIVHGGHEQFNLPSPRMQETYRFFIDAGADVIINHHQHCYSGYEIYNGKPIFYGLGNLCFEGSKKSPDSWYEGYLVLLDFNQDISFEIYPYSQFKYSPKITLLDRNAFDLNLSNLNSTIANQDRLKEEVNKYYEQCLSSTHANLDIYTNPIFLKLRKHNLLPTFLTKRMKLRLKNHLICEAHFDKIKYFLK